MPGQPFITPRLSLWLDLVRGLAALAVLLGHAVQTGLYTGPWLFSIALQKDAVTVFFVLSGLVIASSVARSRRGLGDYAVARATRIVPVAVLGIAAGLLVTAAAGGEWADPLTIALALAFLSESWTSGFAPNPLLWSLCYEVWFYALFGAAMFLRGGQRIGWLLLLAAIAGPNVLLLLPAWLVGVALCHWRAARSLPLALARPAVVLAGAMLVIAPAIAPSLLELLVAVLPGWPLGYSLYALSDNLLALAVGAGFIGLRRLCEEGLAVPAWLAGPVRGLAGISFTLYLLHWPMLQALREAGISAGDNPLLFVALLALVTGGCALLAALVELRTPALRAWLLRRRAAGGTISAPPSGEAVPIQPS